MKTSCNIKTLNLYAFIIMFALFSMLENFIHGFCVIISYFFIKLTFHLCTGRNNRNELELKVFEETVVVISFVQLNF